MLAIYIESQLHCLVSANGYYVNIVSGETAQHRIASEQKITFITRLPELSEHLNPSQKDKQHLVFIFACDFAWVIYSVSMHNSPKMVCYGRMQRQQASLVNVHQVKDKTVLLFNNFHLSYLLLERYVKFSKQVQPSYVAMHEFFPYASPPGFQHHKYLVKQYLPDPQTYKIIASSLWIPGEGEKYGILNLGYEQSMSSHYSVYSVKIDLRQYSLQSGDRLVCNIDSRIRAIFNVRGDIAIQTDNQIIYWKTSSPECTNINQITAPFEGKLILIIDAFQKTVLYGCLRHNNKSQAARVNFLAQKAEIELLNIPVAKDALQMFPDTTDLSQSYYLTARQQFVRGSTSKPLLSNYQCHIKQSNLISNSSHNLLIVKKRIGTDEQQLLISQQWIACDVDRYYHDLPLGNAVYLRSTINDSKVLVDLASSLIGTVTIEIKWIQNIGKNLMNISLNQKHKSGSQVLIRQQQSLWLHGNIQITPSSVSSIVSGQSIATSFLFEETIDCITHATVIGDLIFLGTGDQLHVFTLKYARLYIHCFPTELNKIFPLNQINLLGVFLEGSETKLLIMLVKQDRLQLFKTVTIEPCGNQCISSFNTFINTVEYVLTVVSSRLLLCSNESLHKYQCDKIIVLQFQLPRPVLCGVHFDVVKLHSKKNIRTQFLFIEHESVENDSKTSVHIGCFKEKYLVKDIKEVTVAYEYILMLNSLTSEKILFAFRAFPKEQSEKCQNSLLLISQNKATVVNLASGNISLRSLSCGNYLYGQIQNLLDPLNKYANIQIPGISSPFKLSPTDRQDYILAYNDVEIHYCSKGQQIQRLSYYSLINDDFVSFKNYLTVADLNDEEFMLLFGQKMRIKQLKHISDDCIAVLFDNCIILLQIGYNNALVVRQTLKFSRLDPLNEALKIIELLQSYDRYGIYVLDTQSRIFVLKMKDSANYCLQFHSFSDEEIQCFGRVSLWHDRSRVYTLVSQPEPLHTQQFILKSDGQLLINDSIQSKQELSKAIYL